MKAYKPLPIKAKILTMTLDEFRKAYAVNRRRRRLLRCLEDELAVIGKQCVKFSLIVFGSYITGKPEPGDIDVLISLLPRKECVFSIMEQGLERKHRDEVDVQFQRGEFCTKSAAQLVAYFNDNPLNFNKGIRLIEVVELVLPRGCGE